MRKFAERLKELRTERGLSMDELGKALKLSSGTISNWENYKHDIKGDQLIIVARFFGCSTDYLLGEKDDY